MADEYNYFCMTEFALPPIKGSIDAAGYDLRSAYDNIVPRRGKQLLLTDLSFYFPQGCYGRIAPRSGLALKHSIDVGAGVIDADYTGNVGVLLFNHSDEDFRVGRGDRIAQVICEVYKCPQLKQGSMRKQTERGERGFGSTGLN